jgi:hypothetical protein
MTDSLPDEGRKFTLRLGREAVSDLEWIADQYGGITLTEVFRRAVATEKFLLQRQRNGDIILLENGKSGQQRELVLR